MKLDLRTPPAHYNWHKKFVWYPVITTDGHFAWFETVHRRCRRNLMGADIWEHRLERNE